jgi:hypothetical protein
MKGTLFFVMLLATVASAQESSNQRYQLFQAKYISTNSVVSISSNEKDTSLIQRSDTCLAVFKIDTQTGQTWYLRSERIIRAKDKNILDSWSGFEWIPFNLAGENVIKDEKK